MSELIIRSAGVFDAHSVGLADAQSALYDDIQDAQDQLQFFVDKCRLAVEAAEEELSDLQDQLSEACEDEEVSQSRIDDLTEQIDDQRRRVADTQDTYDAALASQREAEARFDEIQRDFVRRAAFARSRLDAVKAQWLIYMDITYEGDGSGHGGSAATSFSAPPPGTFAPLAAFARPTAMAAGKPAPALPTLPAGLQWVPLDALDWAEVPNDIEFRKAQPAEMKAMLETFMSEVVPMLRSDPALNRDALVATDRVMNIGQGGLVSPQSLAFAWDCMVGGTETITLEPPHAATGGHFGWQNGRHRAMLARSMGWTHVPAKVLGQGL